ncbi:MAG TPA: DNA polymerase III subunit delta [Gemmatimonadales bacterium]|nr:DNA polymerase III subunit delta [Gemmatimonadales bacterium]
MPTHNYGTFAKAIGAGKFAPAYYFLGAENVLKDEATTSILDGVLDPGLRDFNLDVRSAQQLEPEDVLSLCTTLPMMADRRVVVVRDVEAWKRKTRGKKAVLQYLEKPIPETVLVLVQGAAADAKEDKPDTDLAKLAYTVAFAGLDTEQAGRWLAREAERMGITFAPGAEAHLLKTVGTDLGALRSELQKLHGLASEGPVTLERLGALVGVWHGETPYDWRDAVMRGDTSTALRLTPVVLSQTGVTGVRLAQLLGTALVATAAARAHYDRRARGRQLNSAVWDFVKRSRPAGLASWGDEVNNFCRWAESWTQPRLRAALKAALDADRASKSTTITGDLGTMQELVVRLKVGD